MPFPPTSEVHTYLSTYLPPYLGGLPTCLCTYALLTSTRCHLKPSHSLLCLCLYMCMYVHKMPYTFLCGELWALCRPMLFAKTTIFFCLDRSRVSYCIYAYHIPTPVTSILRPPACLQFGRVCMDNLHAITLRMGTDGLGWGEGSCIHTSSPPSFPIRIPYPC